jgi:hypothetical protein
LLGDFLDRGDFEITIDNGLKAITVTPELLPYLRHDTKLVMSVVTFQNVSRQQTTVLCPSCHEDIQVEVSVDMDARERVFWCVEVKSDLCSALLSCLSPVRAAIGASRQKPESSKTQRVTAEMLLEIGVCFYETSS